MSQWMRLRPNPGRRWVVLGVLLLGTGFNLICPPWYAVRTDEPKSLHTSVGAWPLWSPPTARDAFERLQERFPDRITGSADALPRADLERLYAVRLNVVRYVLHWAVLALLVALLPFAFRRRASGAPPSPIIRGS
ncbi:MAG: hypothetical protein KA419_02980 [Acidobacteria bacterium]|nr:hypothetical protein [Acidobacteriota bacterium]